MAEILWTPSDEKKNSSLIQKFIEESSLNFDNYFDLHKWSVNNIEEFWGKFWDFSDIIYSKNYDTVLSNSTMTVINVCHCTMLHIFSYKLMVLLHKEQQCLLQKLLKFHYYLVL